MEQEDNMWDMDDAKWDAQITAQLAKIGRPRTRENYIIMLFGEVPDEWNEDREAQLPRDMQVWPAPPYALGH